MADGLLGILRHEAFEFAFGLLMFDVRRARPRKHRGEFCPVLEELMSTIRTASIRGFGGSMPNRVGVSPFSTQRQNFRSAVMIRCW